MKFLTLSNGSRIPMLGFGTFRMPDDDSTVNAVAQAISAGYRHIDGAAIYGNERSVGEGIRQSGINRSELFVTSKVWNDDKGYESTKVAFHKTLSDLGLDYLDLYLIHWPVAKKSREHWQETNRETWKAMEELYVEGKIKAIGVSNFYPHHLESLCDNVTIRPMVNQIELHPGLPQSELLEYCQRNDIAVEAWAPFANGKIFDNEILQEIAGQHGRSVAQIALSWVLSKNAIALSKSMSEQRMKENLDVTDIILSDNDIARIDNIRGYEDAGADPDNIDF